MVLQELTNMTYQGAKKKINKLDIEEVVILNQALEEHLTYTYSSINKFGEGSISDSLVSQKEYFIMMKGIKKLEIINGYLLDKINETEFMNVRGIDKVQKVC